MLAHSILPVKFEPGRSAYWLSKSGQLAASRLPTEAFWGLRTSFADRKRDNTWPPWLFVISSYPSPFPVENASFTLGPRVVSKTGAIVDTDADLSTTSPLPTSERGTILPLYLHNIPALHINTTRCSGLTYIYFTLTEDNLRTFHDGVDRCLGSALAKTDEAVATQPFEEVKNGWFAPEQNQDTGAHMFGGPPSDPQKYVFNFDFEENAKLPSFEGPSSVYDELMLYNQLCKDYHWRGVDLAIQWVQIMRASTRSGWVQNPDTFATTLPTEVRLDDDLRKRAMELAALDNPHARIASVLDARHAQRLEQAPENDLDWTDSSDSSDMFLPGKFSDLPFRYPSAVPFGPTKVVVFDILGTILDRENALKVALGPWFAQSPVRSTTILGLVVDRFLTLEALAERDAQAFGTPTSLATSVLDERDAQRLEQAAAPHSPSGWSDSSDSSVKFLPEKFRRLPFSYPVVPFGPTKVVAFDIFGTILDREQAITVALGPWFADSPVRRTTTLGLVADRFLTLEALAERDAQTLGTPTSFATCARSALIDLARELNLDVDVRSAIFTETLKCILSPKPYPDVEPAIASLKQRGYTLICLPTHSPTTMQQLRPFFPPAFADSNVVQMWTEHISAHFVAPPPFFTTSKLQSFCESVVKETLQPSEILVVSSSIGRVLHTAVNARHATALVRRPWYLEGGADFIVGDDQSSCPVPSLVVNGLMELVARL
ncbi:hypothetical protein L227DRAFT_546058 [Lentinus tigrinus ALCF2SS1-6]|uniref:HAD-like protein n=1 Tax=Lentinus tigrinus ALCF2SS1-6 TaxID=1328759 RepID=A0A5C2SDF1_9APHY|nr:hypothetical protein L227DRAFT_546058 [Lentinus tigrinus ALCF2SS1-6]